MRSQNGNGEGFSMRCKDCGGEMRWNKRDEKRDLEIMKDLSADERVGSIARRYGVTRAHVYNVKRRMTEIEEKQGDQSDEQ